MDIDIDKLQEQYKISEEEFNKNLIEVYNELIINVSKAKQPKFIMVGGQAGSGKTDLVAKKMSEMEGEAVIIDQDELRTKYPEKHYSEIVSKYDDRVEYLILKPYITRMIRELLIKAREDGYNVIIESALQRVSRFIEYTKEFNDAGYTSELAIISVPELEANLSMLYRYCHFLEKDGICRRNSNINEKATSNMYENIRNMDEMGIFQNIEVYIRGNNNDKLPKRIYSQKENKDKSPIEAMGDAKVMSLPDTLNRFNQKYNYIKGILEKYNEKDKLGILENLYGQYIEIEESR